MVIRWVDATAMLQSEYTGGADGRAYAVTIHGEIRGEGSSLDEAQPRLGRAIASTFPLIALAANAAIAPPLPIAAHGLDLASPQRFVGYQTPGPNEWFPPGARKIDVPATTALATKVVNHPESALLQRAIETYRRALSHWVPEEHLLAGEFLFISAETLSRFLIESRAATRGVSPKNLARLEGAQSEKQLRWRFLRDEIFAGDEAALDAMTQASNGFEHGYMAIDEVRGLISSVLEQSFGFVRRALIDASGADAASRNRLLGESYDEPRGLVPVVRSARGHLSRRDDGQPPGEMPGGAIELEWDVRLLHVASNPHGTARMTWRSKAEPTKLPPNTTLDITGYTLRAAHVTPAQDPPQSAGGPGDLAHDENDET